jgi:hypothetical protein
VKKSPRHPSFISPLNGSLSPLQSTSNQHLQAGNIEALSTLAIEGTQPPPPRLRLIKGPPPPVKIPTPPTLLLVPTMPTSSPFRAKVPPPVRRLLTAFQASVLAKIFSLWRPPLFSPPHGMPSWPGAAARLSSDELHGWPLHYGPHPALVHEAWTESMPIPIRK